VEATGVTESTRGKASEEEEEEVLLILRAILAKRINGFKTSIEK
jgi:hypothetical protein